MEALRDQGAGRHLISVDEKTGIQALERIAADQPMQAGQVRRLEYDRVAGRYERHGTTCLMAATDVAQGKVVHCRLYPTCTEVDFLVFIQGIAGQLPVDEEVVFLAVQLHTHLSASWVEWVAGQIGFEGDVGKKNYKCHVIRYGNFSSVKELENKIEIILIFTMFV